MGIDPYRCGLGIFLGGTETWLRMMMLLLTVVSLKAEGMMSSWGLQKCEPGEMQTDSSLSDEWKFFLASFISLARRVTSVFTVIPRIPPKKKN